MSIKIYNGYLIKGVSLQSFQQSLPSKRLTFRQEILPLLHKRVADLIVRTCDISALFTPENDNQYVLGLAQETLKKDVIDSTVVGRKTRFDCEIDLMVKAHESDLLVLYYGPNMFEDQVKRLFDLTEFGYWNNTDEPEGVSSDQWAERCKIWGAALPDWASPVESGFLRASLCSATEVIGMPHEFDSAHLTSIEDRITRCVETIKRHIVSTALDAQGGLGYAELKKLEQVAMNWLADAENAEAVGLDTNLRVHLTTLLPVFDTQNSFAQRYSLEAVGHSCTRELVNQWSTQLASVLKQAQLPG